MVQEKRERERGDTKRELVPLHYLAAELLKIDHIGFQDSA